MPGLGSSGGGFAPSSSSGVGLGGGSKAGIPKKGMQLGKSKGASSLLENLAKEEGVATLDEPSRPSAAAGPVGTHVISGALRRDPSTCRPLVCGYVSCLAAHLWNNYVHSVSPVVSSLCA